MKATKKLSLAAVAKKVANMTQEAKARYIDYLYNLTVTEVERAMEAATM